ncbi:hypothetical protein N9N67_08125 [Bacteriovoracaceae bacterium]|nr:hypothetical protein [Bacteriovoracaceae bacterium]
MKNGFTIFFKSISVYFCVSLLLISCLPRDKTRNVFDEEIVEETSEGVDTTVTNTLYPLSFFHQNSYIQKVVVDKGIQTDIYLRGTNASEYLGNTDSNLSGSYCMRIKFFGPVSQTVNDLYMKATPSKVYNSTNKAFEYYFRLNTTYANNTENNACLLDEEVYNPNTNSTNLTALPVTSVSAVTNVCSGCNDFLTSSTIQIFTIADSTSTPGTNALYEIDRTIIDPTALEFKINQNNDTNNNNSNVTCTNIGCQAQGFDCCNQNQCVNEGQVKTNGVNSDQSGYALAELEKIANPLWYLNYPQFYHACFTIPNQNDNNNGTTGGTDTTAGNENEAQIRLDALIEDYECIEELSSNSAADPFHTEPYNGTPSDYTECNVTTSTDDMYYQVVMERLYENCGCGLTDFNEMVSLCPAYTYQTVLAEDGVTIANVLCLTPQNEQGQFEWEDLSVALSSKASPQRFFNTDGDEVRLDQELPTNTTQEGTAFSYLDTTKIFPDANGSNFNMNSITGQLTTDLSAAIPAKVIDVEIDQVYHLMTTNGNFTFCEECARDYWFQNFSAYPMTPQGVGLRFHGYSTDRSTWDGNFTRGDYEETHFGRACFVPPTMLPFSHGSNSDSQTQRLNRLKTQATLFVNGYQRDWYGFNRGAVIGSFDGVKWFAIGKARIVRATSNQMYLAINAPYSDLALDTQHTLAIKEYDGISTGAHYDYNPDLDFYHPLQNEAGLCQANHYCATDADCITRLGWEYACVDVGKYKTKVPEFMPDGAVETASSAEEGSIANYLQEGEILGDSSLRCVYRGAGSICRQDLDSISEESERKAFACGPNFYCASLDDQEFNNQVARYGTNLESVPISPNHLYGYGAKRLGRPFYYVTDQALNSLDSTVKTILQENIALSTTTSTANMGLCRPGKSLPDYATSITVTNNDPLNQHDSKDAGFGTDYISQVGSCNSTLYLPGRHSSCPILDSDGNIYTLSDSYLSLSSSLKEIVLNNSSSAQNMCALESLEDNTNYGYGISDEETLKNSSPFASIEGAKLTSSTTVIAPQISVNACLRKAGQVCHTNLDCGPNSLHASQTELFDLSYFGNQAEKDYYSEHLICGQGDEVPNQLSDDFWDYDMTENLCCRAVGEDITMYSEDDDNDFEGDLFGAFNPSDPQRYSRYSVLGWSNISQSGSQIKASSGVYNIPSGTLTDILNPYQWKTINDTGAKTCCGGGWIRKFEDGSNDWTVNRLNIDVSNFRCLNYRTPYISENTVTNIDPTYTGALAQSFFLTDQNKLCLDGSSSPINDGCAQIGLDDTSTGFLEIQPGFDDWASDDTKKAKYSPGTFYDPDFNELLWAFRSPDVADAFGLKYMDYSQGIDDYTKGFINVYLPAHITGVDTTTISIRELNGSSVSTSILCDDINVQGTGDTFFTDLQTAITAGTVEANMDGDTLDLNLPIPGYNSGILNTLECAAVYDPANKQLFVIIKEEADGVTEEKDYSFELEYTPAGTASWVNNTDNSINYETLSSTGGNFLYYSKRLAKLELNGIPQTTFAPLYCVNDFEKLVPGIFDESILTMDDFQGLANAFDDTNISAPHNTSSNTPITGYTGDQSVVRSEYVESPQIFSENDFMCCQKLGTITTTPGNCCSGYSVSAGINSISQNQYECKLFEGTDLSVYFNRFVSGEGIGEDEPGGGLEDTDFDATTGEPLITSSVLEKLNALGEEYCESGTTRRGGAFGRFPPEPKNLQSTSSSVVYSIVDSTGDVAFTQTADGAIETGYYAFQVGFRWNHHVYCDIPDNN